MQTIHGLPIPTETNIDTQLWDDHSTAVSSPDNLVHGPYDRDISTSRKLLVSLAKCMPLAHSAHSCQGQPLAPSQLYHLSASPLAAAKSNRKCTPLAHLDGIRGGGVRVGVSAAHHCCLWFTFGAL